MVVMGNEVGFWFGEKMGSYRASVPGESPD